MQICPNIKKNVLKLCPVGKEYYHGENVGDKLQKFTFVQNTGHCKGLTSKTSIISYTKLQRAFYIPFSAASVQVLRPALE